MAEQKHLVIKFSAFAPSIMDQVVAQGYRLSTEDADKFDKLAKAVVLLNNHRVVTDGEAHKARNRLGARIKSAVEAYMVGTKPEEEQAAE